MSEGSGGANTSLNFGESELALVAEKYAQTHLQAGQELFAEGSQGDYAYIVLDGELDVVKTVAGREVLLNVIRRGEVVGEMALLENRPRMASVRARSDAALISVNQAQFNEVLSTCPAVTRDMLSVVLARTHVTEARLHQTQHMANWNTLTAGVAHGLNNPAAAIKRSAERLKEALDRYGAAQAALGRLALTPAQQAALDALHAQVRARAVAPDEPDALACSAREAEVEAWLDNAAVPQAWDLAPSLVSAGLGVERLAALAAQVAPGQLPPLVTGLAAAFNAYSLLAEIAQASARVSQIVGVLKGYSFLDQAPIQAVNLAEGLETTLLILDGRVGEGVTVRREFAPDLPLLMAAGRELNQAWTNLLDNALRALDGHGEIVVRAHCDPERKDWVTVEIEDNGPGIPPEIQPLLFEPFLAAEQPGAGGGLGLNITYNILVQKHRGEIGVDSAPGRTVFTVRLPVNFEQTPGAVSS